MRRYPVTSIALLLVVLLLFALVSDEALARAGGGGGRRGTLIANPILLPFLAIYSAILSYLLLKKHRQSKAILDQAKVDEFGPLDRIKKRIEDVYFKVQEAWMVRDQSLARDCMSESLFQKHELQTDQMLRSGTGNMLEGINLVQATIVEVADFKDDSKDQFWAHIEGSMIDYTSREATGEVINGDKNDADCLRNCGNSFVPNMAGCWTRSIRTSRSPTSSTEIRARVAAPGSSTSQ